MVEMCRYQFVYRGVGVHMNAGQTVTLRIAHKHLKLFINLAELLSKNASRLHEADQV